MPTRLTPFRYRCLLGALLLLSACSGSRSEAVVERPVTLADVNAFLQEMLDDAPALTYSDLVERLGPPVRVDAHPGPAPPDTLRTLLYHGLELTLREGASPPASRPMRLALTDPRYTSPEGLRVGYAESQVLSTLGLPTERESARFVYAQTDAPRWVLVVFLEHDVVSRLEWSLEEE